MSRTVHRPTLGPLALGPAVGTVSRTVHRPTLGPLALGPAVGTVSRTVHRPTLGPLALGPAVGTVSRTVHRPTLGPLALGPAAGTVSRTVHRPTLGPLALGPAVGTVSRTVHRPYTWTSGIRTSCWYSGWSELYKSDLVYPGSLVGLPIKICSDCGFGNMRITESLQLENDRRGYQQLCSDCEAYGLKKGGLTRSDSSVWTAVIGHLSYK